MTRDEQRRALRRILEEAAEIKKSIEAPAVRVLAASITLLTIIIDEQNKRIDALESCREQGAPDMPHQWAFDGTVIRCQWCGTVKS